MSDTHQPQDRGAAGTSAEIGRQPYTHPVDGNLGAARAEEHAAPAPTTRTSGKLWIIAGLVLVAAAAALLSGY